MNISKLHLKVGDAVEVWPLSWSDSGLKKYQAVVQKIWTESKDLGAAVFLHLYDGQHLRTVNSSQSYDWGIRKLTAEEAAILLVHWS